MYVRDDLSGIKQCFKVIDASKKLLLAEADKLDRIEDKLDRLLEIESRKIESWQGLFLFIIRVENNFYNEKQLAQLGRATLETM